MTFIFYVSYYNKNKSDNILKMDYIKIYEYSKTFIFDLNEIMTIYHEIYSMWIIKVYNTSYSYTTT